MDVEIFKCNITNGYIYLNVTLHEPLKQIKWYDRFKDDQPHSISIEILKI